MTVKAPFNFVPVSDKVYFPEWASYISHDIPFEDGVSGRIKVKITARSPIFVRNGHTQGDADEMSDAYKQFSNVDGKYYIPGTSVKGAVRSVLEIMSFGKMTTQETHKYAHREWDYDGNNGSVCLYQIKGSKLGCGWLRKKSDGTYSVQSCGKPWRISFKDLDKYLGKNLFEQNFSKANKKSADLNVAQKDAKKANRPEDDPKSAMFKYRFFDDLKKTRDGIHFAKIPSKGKPDKRKVRIDENGEMVGSIVLTGQPDVSGFIDRKQGDGKFYEFVFQDKPEKNYPISEEMFKDLAYIYKDNPEWAYHAKNLETKDIPVFFREEGFGDRAKLVDCGLAYMYKQPFTKSPADWIPSAHNSNNHDLAESIFGYIAKEKDNPSLKGRVQFGHAFSESTTGCKKDVEFVLANPKASYYPLYAIDGSWDDAKSIAGRKRYVVRTGEYGVADSVGTDNMKSMANVLNAGAIFEETITFHNLKHIELGALLSALTFHNNAKCLHSIGQGKPFGWGATSLEIEELVVEGEREKDCLKYMGEFENAMDDFLGSAWVDDAGVKELCAMATPIPTEANSTFEYMKLDNGGVNEFNKQPARYENLDRFRKIASLKKWNNWQMAEPKSIVNMPSDEKEKVLADMEMRIQKSLAKEAERAAERAAVEQERQAEEQKKAAKKASMDLSFLNGITTFKEGKSRIEGNFKQLDLIPITPEVLDLVPDEARQCIENFVVRMFARPEKKWGSKNKDFAKDAAIAEVKKWFGADYKC